MAKIPAILVVDQDAKARYEVKRLVKQSHFDIAGEAGFGTEAVSTAVELEPDVVLVGVSEPVMRSLQTVESLLNALPQTPVIVYSFEPEIDLARKAMVAGARDFVVMPANAEEMGKSIVTVLESEERRQMRERGQTLTWGPQGTIITIFGPKGGIGKTTIAVNLSVALVGATGQSVALVDADYGFGDVAGMLDLPPERSIVDLARDSASVTREMLPNYLSRHASGLDVVPGPAQTMAWRGVKPEDFRRAVELLSKSHDIVVIDTAGTLNDITLAALEAASLVLWIVTTDFASVRDSLRALEALRSESYPLERVRVLVNDLAMSDGVRPSTIEEALGREIFWRVPFDQRVRQGAQTGEPAVIGRPSAPGARNLADLARTVVGIKPPRESLLGRVFGRNKGPRVSRETTAKETEG
ncbi:MAG: response regulator [Dehalococcoidia bacterium]|nr:response regulator [Dehalococcoidia bacterium]